MKQTVNFYDFCRAFEVMDRNENFSYEGKTALFDYLEDYEESCDVEVELDVIALCCEYTEFENIEEFHKEYDADNYPDMDTIRDYTQVITWSDTPEVDGFIIQQF